MYREPPKMAVCEIIRLLLNYLIPVIIRGAIVARPSGMRALINLYRDPIGVRYFTGLQRNYHSGLLAGYADNDSVFGLNRAVIVLDV